MTPKTRIYLIRHGEVEGAGGGIRRYNGQTDVGLSARGKAMYHDLKERFAGTRIAACYTSDLTRCAWGAEVLGAHLGVTPVRHPELRELNMGSWEGRSWDELVARHPEEWQARLADVVNYRVPGGENALDVHRRVMPVINGIVERHRGEEVLVVAHGGVNRVILLNAIGAPLSSLFAIEQTYCCLNIIDYFADGNTVVKLVNG
ncbi:alpha-ribazole phosphatase [Geobacter pickeringii]|uniref:Alpha-ribazole phosphatase n=1 Tax=Geobacter pickeringii TaxID=345632 RepID=A0A0B5BED3_9BACT|nr:alpha-ribazole phosphatase [Geobacter pickeringii]AJE02416.1 phosphoglucomutase [Geobacter pickeringii]